MARFLSQRLRLQQMRVVDAIATHRSLKKAAAALGLTQPALTKGLQELEDVLGVRIFERQARGTEPNRMGEAVIAAARRMLAEAERLQDELERLRAEGADAISIGALPVAAAGVVPGALATLKARHPGIIVKLTQGTTNQLLPALVAGDIDLVVGRLYAPARPDGLVRESIYEEPLAVLMRAGHALLKPRRVRPRDLLRYQLVLPTIGQRLGQEIEPVLTALGLAGNASPLRTSSISLIRELLLEGDAVTIMPQQLLAGDIARGAIKIVKLPLGSRKRPAGLIRAKDRPISAATEAFIMCLRESIAAVEKMDHRGTETRRRRRDWDIRPKAMSK